MSVLTRRNPFFQLSMCFVILHAGVIPSAFACTFFFSGNKSGDSVERFRHELRTAAHKISSSPHPLSYLKPKTGSESSLIDPESFSGATILYFGSQLDITRPLIAFPLATHFHFVDPFLLTGENIHGEIQRRIRTIHKSAEVRVIDEGYARSISKRQLNHLKKTLSETEFVQPSELKISPQLAIERPMVIRVSWVSSSVGPQEKIFYLHPFYYESKSTSPTEATGRLSDFTKKWLAFDDQKPVGILNFAAPIPRKFDELWEHLPSGSVVLHAAYKPAAHSDWSNGQPTISKSHHSLPNKTVVWADLIYGSDRHLEAPYLLFKN